MSSDAAKWRTGPHWVTLLTLVTASTFGCGGPEFQLRLVGETTMYEGIVTAAHGSVVQVGEECAVALRGTNHPGYNCRIVIRCGDELLYGLADSGYNHCEVGQHEPFTAAIDRYPTRADGDPRMRFDIERGQVLVSDDNPDLRLEVALRRPEPTVETSTGRATGG